MKIYMKDGTQIKIQIDEQAPLLEADFGKSPGYVHIKKYDGDHSGYYTLMTITKENLLFIDYDNKEKAGVKMEIIAHQLN